MYRPSDELGLQTKNWVNVLRSLLVYRACVASCALLLMGWLF